MRLTFLTFSIPIILICILGPQVSYATSSCYTDILHDLTTYKVDKTFNDGALDGYNDLMKIGVEKSLQKTAHHFYGALRNGDNHALHLEKMGFRFHPNKTGVMDIKAPELKEVVSYYDEKMIIHVRNGDLEKDDILKMSRIFFKGEGPKRELIAIPLGDEVPINFFPYDGFVDSKSFYKFIADKKFIIGENIQLNSDQSFFMHDLAHFTSFIDNPKYMKALIEYSKDITKNNKGLLSTKKASSPPLRFEALETLASVKPKHVKEVRDLLNIPSHLKDQKFISVDDLKVELSKNSMSQIDSEIETLIKKFPFFIDYIGGSSRDIAIRSSASSKVMGELGFFGRTLLQRNHELKNVSKEQNFVEHLKSGFRGLRKTKKVEELAKFKSYVHGIMNISPEKWLTSLKGDELVKDSPIQEFFRSSGLDQYDEYQLYNMHNKTQLKNNKKKAFLIKSMLTIGGYMSAEKLSSKNSKGQEK